MTYGTTRMAQSLQKVDCFARILYDIWDHEDGPEYFIFLNTALMNWLSKKQETIEGSVFGAEFVAMKTRVEALRGIRYKLRMMGVPLTVPTYVYGDNMSVIYNTL